MNETTGSKFIESVAHVLDSHCEALKQSILEEAGRLALERDKQTHEAISLSQEAIVQRDAAMSAAKDLAERNSIALEGSLAYSNLLEQALIKSISLNKSKQIAKKCIENWFSLVTLKKHEATAQNFHDKGVLRKLFGKWRRRQNETNQNQQQNLAESLKRSQKEIEYLRKQLELAREEALKTQDQLRRALVRGVCALNIEAMSAIIPPTSTSFASSSNSMRNNTNISLPYQSASEEIPQPRPPLSNVFPYPRSAQQANKQQKSQQSNSFITQNL